MPLNPSSPISSTSTVDPRLVAPNAPASPPPIPPKSAAARAAFTRHLLTRVPPAPVHRRASIKRHPAPQPPRASTERTPLAAPAMAAPSATPIRPPRRKDQAPLRALENSPERAGSLRQRAVDAMPRPLRRACAAVAVAFRRVVWTLSAPLRA